MKLIFATQNKNKLQEVKKLLRNDIELFTPWDFNFHDEIPETGETLTENALQKAYFIYEKLKQNCFADDTGLEVEALNGAPGVYSARYAGEEKSADKNMDKLLFELNNNGNRKACFKTVIALLLDGKEYLFEGRIDGYITNEKRGNSGFGYDPVFIPDGFDNTFAEMTIEEKNLISHRAIAVKKLAEFLNHKD
jgi:XTP/dITP diphosphohydrolase